MSWPRSRLRVLVLVLVAVGAPAAARAQPAADTPLPELVVDRAACPPVEACVGLTVHVVVRAGAPVVDAAWVRDQVGHATRLFAPAGLGFIVTGTRVVPETAAVVSTRRDRDRLGRRRLVAGTVDVFVVDRLDDVDVAGQVLNGVHWRQRDQRERRWIIVAATARPVTLAHELGHFFGLPHSTELVSLMNKTPGPGRPAMLELRFTEAELATIVTTARGLRRGRLRAP
ncbi:MAG: hypothetical protein KBG28_20555 [Kofleriaceae bacterium]|nr:hypothetical protein [Kofleriaceae bacterium]MBP9206376.1 hypothetical protein [Kofleriaceae bacterium]